MKKLIVRAFALLICLFAVSCIKKNTNTGALEFDRVELNKTVHLFGDTAKPGTNIIIDFTYVSKSSDAKLKDSLNALISSACFGEQFIDENIKEIAGLYANNYVNEYRQDLEPMYLEDLKNKENAESITSWYSYYKGIESKVLLYEKDLLVYRIDLNEYTGGAHGMFISTFLNIDLKHVHLLNLADIFVGNYQDMLIDLLWNQLMADEKVKTRVELEDMGYGSTGDLVPTENFCLGKEGITFYYNVYEFTPYSMGPVEITLPYEMMDHILSEEPIIKELRN